MARVAASHLHRDAPATSLPGHAIPAHHTAQAEPHGQRPDKALVAVTLPPPQLMIEMSNYQVPVTAASQPVKNFEKDYGINSSRDRDEHPLTVREQCSVKDIRFDFSDQPVHAGMVEPNPRNGKRRETPVSRRISSRPTARS